MAVVVAFLLRYGYAGMLAAAFLAGSFFPFSSEAVMTGLKLVGLNVWILFITATVGNTLGGLFNYSIGRLGDERWIYHLFNVREKRMIRAQNFVHRYGAWIGLLAWLPILGSVITIAMGMLRVNFWKSSLSILAGKTARYVVLALILQNVQP